jgi:hypothetical protein
MCRLRRLQACTSEDARSFHRAGVNGTAQAFAHPLKHMMLDAKHAASLSRSAG